MSARVTSSRLIGRIAELAVLAAMLEDAAAGTPGLAFLAGDSGVGKSRLLAEAMRAARERGALVLSGDCVNLGESELPYAPLVAALRPLARARHPALAGDAGTAVAPLLPGSAPAAGDAPEPGAQARLFEGLLSLLDALGAHEPVLLVVEDLHWADRSTRAALAFLARSLSRERVALVASYRPDELHRRHPLRPLLAELERNPRARRMSLAPLDRDELAAQLEDILGAPPAAELLDRLWSRSGGNPLFCEELLAAGLDGRGAPPDTLRDALMVRVERLSERAQEVLRLVAVGQRLDHRLLEQASGLAPRELREALREAVAGHILVADEDGGHRFRHALLREVVEDDLLPGERAALHLALARALEQRLDGRAGAQLSAAVAHHYAAAGDQPRALSSAVRAADAAERVHAHGEALALLERALELWDRVPDPEACAGADRVTLLARAGDAAGALGDSVRQLAFAEAALAALGPDPDPVPAARVHGSVARAQRSLNRTRESVRTTERGLALLEGLTGQAAVERARLLAALARGRMLDGRMREGAEAARRALAEAAAAGAAAVEGHARNTLGVCLVVTGDVEAGTAELQSAVRIARARGDAADLAEAYVNLSESLHVVGRTAEALDVAREGRAALEGRRPVATVWLATQIAELAFASGDWAAAAASLPGPQRSAGPGTRINVELRRAELALGRGDHDAVEAALPELERLAEGSRSPHDLSALGSLASELRRRQGDLAAARAAVEHALDRLEFCTEDAPRMGAVSFAGVTVEADIAVHARDLGDSEGERGALRRLDDLLARVASSVAPSRPVERALLLGARAEAARAAGREDPGAFAAAADAFDDVGRPELAARMRWREAEAHVAAGEREAATAAARAAHAVAERLGAGWLRGEIEGLAARARLALAPGAPPAPEEPEDPFGLTARERQVLALVAEGATNREIGQTLYMAEKTASVHVSRILSKLNVRSRTEAAALAHRHGFAHR